MNKHLLTLARLLSLLAVNQASCWTLNIKNEAAKQVDLSVNWSKISGDRLFGNREIVQILPGQTKNLESVKNKQDRHLVEIQLLTPVGPGKWNTQGADENFFIGNRDSRYQKGLIIKTGSDGKPVMVENP